MLKDTIRLNKNFIINKHYLRLLMNDILTSGKSTEVALIPVNTRSSYFGTIILLLLLY